MTQLSYSYLGLEEKPIPDKEDLFKSGIPEASKLRNMISTIQRLFITSNQSINLSILGDSCFKITVYTSGTKKSLISTLYYIPGETRLDMYDSVNPELPMFVWKNKRCVLRNVGPTLQTLKVETLFLPIVAYT